MKIESTMTPENLDEFMRGYFVCALWSSTDDEKPIDDDYDIDDIDLLAAAAQKEECEDFIRANYPDLLEYLDHSRTWASAGHDFWLTRNRHGAGFWDRGLGELGDRLSDAAKVYGEKYVYPNNGKVYIE